MNNKGLNALLSGSVHVVATQVIGMQNEEIGLQGVSIHVNSLVDLLA